MKLLLVSFCISWALCADLLSHDNAWVRARLELASIFCVLTFAIVTLGNNATDRMTYRILKNKKV